MDILGTKSPDLCELFVLSYEGRGLLSGKSRDDSYVRKGTVRSFFQFYLIHVEKIGCDHFHTPMTVSVTELLLNDPFYTHSLRDRTRLLLLDL